MYYLCSENKGADQLRGCREADLLLCFRIYAKIRFSHNEAQFVVITPCFGEPVRNKLNTDIPYVK